MRKEARWKGATSDAVDAAVDGDEPTMALVNLIAGLQSKQTGSVADIESDARLDVAPDAHPLMPKISPRYMVHASACRLVVGTSQGSPALMTPVATPR